jgi:hypothetical protein
MMTMKRTWIGVALGLGASRSAVPSAPPDRRETPSLERRAEERIATWEGEGGAPMQGTAPAH